MTRQILAAVAAVAFVASTAWAQKIEQTPMKRTAANDGAGMFNAQAEGGGWHGNGGDGWLRILEFHPDGKTVTVHTFSPLFAVSPSTVGLSLRTEPYDHFSFSLE